MKLRLLMLSAFCMVPLIAAAAPAEGESHWIAPHEGTQKIGSTPCPIFRSSFTLDAEPVSGTVKVVGLGHYELLLNGTRPGEALINQPWSEYNKTIYYQEFDIAKS
jgi:alpha-L-rhamnosidase